jgi:CheY-like chemotaxis protein
MRNGVRPVPADASVVLVVDDDKDQRFLLERALTRAGHEVRTAADGAEALDRLAGVDLVLLDYRLPDMSGIDVLRSLSRRTGPAVVMVTAEGNEDVAVEAMRVGAVDYLVKARTYIEDLPGVVERALRHRDVARRARELQRLAVVVHSAMDRSAMCAEIVQGARELLRAGSAGVFVATADGEVQMAAGDSRGSAAMAARVAALVREVGGRQRTAASSGSLLVPLPRGEGLPVGALAVWDREQRTATPEEVELAETFAAFAATALGSAARLDLERAAVAELQEALDYRGRVAQALAEELRTPLSCVVGFAETLLAEWDVLDDEVRQACIRSMCSNALELRTLVERLLGQRVPAPEDPRGQSQSRRRKNAQPTTVSSSMSPRANG